MKLEFYFPYQARKVWALANHSFFFCHNLLEPIYKETNNDNAKSTANGFVDVMQSSVGNSNLFNGKPYC